jgi:hypothetical protein
VLEAQLVGIVTTIVLERPAVAVAVKRASPWPAAWATKSYVAGTNGADEPSAVAPSVSAIGVARAS